MSTLVRDRMSARGDRQVDASPLTQNASVALSTPELRPRPTYRGEWRTSASLTDDGETKFISPSRATNGTSHSKTTATSAVRTSRNGDYDHDRNGNGMLDNDMEVLDASYPELGTRYSMVKKVGEGTFGTVWKARREHDNFTVAIKRLYPTSASRLAPNEVELLMRLGGQHHVPELLDGLRYRDHVSLVMPYFPHAPFRTYYLTMSLSEMAHYVRALLQSLKYVHENNVIHRDIKPSNFVRSHDKKNYMLLDFGLSHDSELTAQLTQQRFEEAQRARTTNATKKLKKRKLRTRASMIDTSMSNTSRKRSSTAPNSLLDAPTAKRTRTAMLTHTTEANSLSTSTTTCAQNGKRIPQIALRAGTRGFRAPEVLLCVREQTVAIDIWSSGIILLTMLCGRYPFFQSPDDLSSLWELAHIVGTEVLSDTATKYRKRVEFPWKVSRVDWPVVTKHFRVGAENYPESVYDLLDSMLCVDPDERITAADALQHTFFDIVDE